MKKNLLSIILFAFVAIGCSSDSESNPVNMNPSDCSSAVTNFTVQQSGDMLNFNITATPGALYYEASLCPTGQCTGPGATIIPLDVETNSISINGYPFAGDIVVYLRTVCTDSSKGDWYGPKLVSIDEFCGTPYSLTMAISTLYWEYSGVQASNYQVQYGPQGFSLGSGTFATVNSQSFDGASMAAGEAYDFYVRAYCVNGIGYGNWTGPYTHMSQTNYNMCLPPFNIVATVQNTSNIDYKMASFTWNRNGESTFEYTLVADGASPEGGTINTTNNSASGLYNSLYKFNDYDFYVRAVCSNGNRTEWVKKDLNL